MKKLNLLLIILLTPVSVVFSRDSNVIPDDKKYYGKDFFRLEGTEVPDSLKENRYDRLPDSYKNIVREASMELIKIFSWIIYSFSL